MNGDAKLWWSVFLVVLGQSFLFGYGISGVNSAKKDFLKYYCEADYSGYWSTYVVAIQNFGAAIGALLTGYATKNFGPKGCIYYINILVIIACSLFYYSGHSHPDKTFAEADSDYQKAFLVKNNNVSWTEADGWSHNTQDKSFPTSLILLSIGRIIYGLFIGLASGIAPMYIMEIAPKEKRGLIGVLNQLFITVGILVAQITGLPSLLGHDWVTILSLPVLVTIFQTLVLSTIPESPRYMLLTKKEEGKAIELLQSIRGPSANIKQEISEMQAEQESSQKESSLSIMAFFSERSIRWQVITVIFLQICQPLSGINAVFFYSNDIFEKAGIATDLLPTYSIYLGALNVFVTIVSTFIIEKAGRKILMTGGFSVMIIFMIVLIQAIPKGSAFWSVLALLGYIVGFAIGPGPIPWIYNSELMEQNGRSSSNMVGCTTNWLMNVLVAATFIQLQDSMKEKVFYIFIVVCIAATLYTHFIVPETKSKSFTEIYNDFASRNGVPRKDVDEEEGVMLKDQV